MRVLFTFLTLLIFSFIACVSDEKNTFEKTTDIKQVVYSIKHDTTLVLSGDSVDILFPSRKIIGTILVLPGWNFSRKKCCNESSFCTKALAEGYILVLPEMGKSIYASAVYPETRKDWLKYPQLKWVTDTLIPYMNEKAGLLKKDSSNFVFGISTGGRGVALIIEHTGKLFKAGAALSGDFDQRLDTNDNLMKGWYGPYSKYKERWEGEDNALLNADKINVPLYFGHCTGDKVVPLIQSEKLYDILKNNKDAVFNSTKSDCAHDYKYWDTETEEVLKFFGKF